MEIILASDLQPDSIVDGEGIRTVIWTQGCPHNCLGCHNPGTHDFKGGFSIDIENIKKEIERLTGQNGLTFSGGDPMYQPEPCKEIAVFAKKLGLSIWCYTGDKFEEILKNPKKRDFLSNIDVLVDGKFEIDKRSLDLKFKGSSNQRIIDVPKSLKENKVVLVEKYIDKKNYHSIYQKPDHMFI